MNTYIKNILAGSAADSTLDKRIRYLYNLSKNYPDIEDSTFLNDADNIIKVINKSDNVDTKWNSLWHVMALINANPKLITEAAKNKYTNLIETLRIQRDIKHSRNYKTENQKETLKVTLVDRQKQLDELIEELFKRYEIPYKLIAPKDLIKFDKFKFAKELDRLVLIACYLYQPAVRNDWHNLEIISAIKNSTNDRNYLYASGDTMKIILNKYKTAKTYGRQEIKLTPKLTKLLKIWIDLLKKLIGKKPTYALGYSITSNSVEHSSNEDSLRKKLGRYTDTIFGIKLTINDFRHLWEIDIQTNPKYAKMTLEERQAMHMKLLHGLDIAQSYNVQD